MINLKHKILLGWLALVCTVFASDLLVRPADKVLIVTGPRKTNTTMFRVTNQSAQKKEIIIQPQLPKGWKQITLEFPFVMDGNSSEVRLFNFFIPPSTSAGVYDIKYVVQDRKVLSSRDETTIQVQVLPNYKIDINLINYPQYALEDKEYQLSFRVINNSNVPDRIVVDAQTSEKTSVVFDHKVIELQPGKEDTITATLSTLLSKSESMKNHIKIIGFSNASKEKIHKELFLEIIPKKQKKINPTHTLPVKLSLKKVFQQNGSYRTAYQGELYTKGSLNDKKTKNIELRLRGPDIFSQSFLADHDEYFLNYSTPNYKVYVGDGYYKLTPLTEKIRYGRGMSSSLKVDRFLLGGYYQQTRWLRSQEKQVGAFLKYNPAENNYIGLNVLFKNRQANTSIVSLESVLKPNEKNKVELEIASGSNENKISNSYRSKFDGRLAKLGYLFEFIHAGPDFPGYYRDTRFMASGISYNMNKKITVEMNIRQEKQNFDVDSTQYAAPISRFEQLGFYVRPFKRTSINISYLQRSRKDRLQESKFDYNEKAGRIGLSQFIGPLVFYTSAEYGHTFNNLTNSLFDMKRFTASMTLRFMKKNSVRGYFYLDDNQRYTGEKRKRFTVGTSYRQYFAQHSYMNISYQNDYEPEEYFRDRNLLHAEIVHKFAFGHKISIRGRHTLLRYSLHNKESAVLVDYSIPLDVPVSRVSQKSLIQGKIINSETSASIPDMYIRLNNKPVLTDKDGNFSFSNVKPGTYFIYMDESQLGFGKMTMPKLPLEIHVTGGQTEYIEILVVKSASISGQILKADKRQAIKNLIFEQQDNNISAKNNGINEIATYPSGPDSFALPPEILVKEEVLEGIYVDLVGPNGTTRRFTDHNGIFYFDGLVPGKYSVIAYENNLPQYRFFKKKSYEFNVNQGQSHKFVIKAFEKERPILFTRKEEFVLKAEEHKEDIVKNYSFTTRLLQEIDKSQAEQQQSSIDIILGMNYYRIKKYSYALESFNSALETANNTLDVLILLGLTHQKMGDSKSAQSCFQKVANKSQPSLARTIALEYLGTPNIKSNSNKSFRTHYNEGMALFKKQQFEKASEAFSKAIYCTEQPMVKAEGFYFLGRSLLELGIHEKALLVLNNAIKLGTKKVALQALHQSGICNLVLNNEDTAKKQLLQVLVLSPDEKEISHARTRLAQLY